MARACLILVLKTKEEKWGLGKKTKIFKTSLDIILLSDIFFFSPVMKVKNVGVLFFKGDKKTKWLVKWNMEKSFNMSFTHNFNDLLKNVFCMQIVMKKKKPWKWISSRLVNQFKKVFWLKKNFDRIIGILECSKIQEILWNSQSSKIDEFLIPNLL